MAAEYHDGLLEIMDDAVDDEAQLREHAARAVQATWAQALDSYSAMIVLVHEAYGDYYDRMQDRQTIHSTVFAGLMARAVRTAREVDVLLRGGYPAGALARGRTLLECAVVAAVIGQDDTGELSGRYFDHWVGSRWKRTGSFQRLAARLGEEPLPKEEVQHLRSQRKRALDHYGPNFEQPYGWAIPAVGTSQVTFAQLMDLANISHLEPWREWAHNEVHATSHGDELNIEIVDGVEVRLTGATDEGLGDPGQLAVITLAQTCVIALIKSDLSDEVAPRLEDLITAHTVSLFSEHVKEQFAEAAGSYDE